MGFNDDLPNLWNKILMALGLETCGTDARRGCARIPFSNSSPIRDKTALFRRRFMASDRAPSAGDDGGRF